MSRLIKIDVFDILFILFFVITVTHRDVYDQINYTQVKTYSHSTH